MQRETKGTFIKNKSDLHLSLSSACDNINCVRLILFKISVIHLRISVGDTKNDFVTINDIVSADG
jgi:hypothetical protein